jgi:HAMP domain-containing protein
MLEGLLLTVLAVFLVTGALLLLAVWRAVRWVRRSARLRQRVRTGQALLAPPGPRRELAWLRRELAAATCASTEAVALVGTAGGVVGELPRLTRHLGRVAGTLDAELRLLAGEPDPTELARVLPAARARVGDATRVARTIRRASTAALAAETATGIGPLQAEVEREVAALDAGIDRLLALAAGA